MTRLALLSLLCLCALPSLIGCGPKPVRPAPVRVVTVEVPVFTYLRFPRALTDPVAEPLPPPALCAGMPCALDALSTIPAWRGAVQQCNADRARAALLGGRDGE